MFSHAALIASSRSLFDHFAIAEAKAKRDGYNAGIAPFSWEESFTFDGTRKTSTYIVQ